MLEEFITNYSIISSPIHLTILVIRKQIQPKEMIVYFDTIQFKTFSIIRVIYVCFIIIRLFHLKYPVESRVVRLFKPKIFIFN
jgi:hypothetical protein